MRKLHKYRRRQRRQMPCDCLRTRLFTSHRCPGESLHRSSAIHARLAHAVTLAIFALFLTTGCSVKKIAIRKLGDALAQGGSTYASDEDPDLIKQAVPFSLKLMESLLAESPRHQGLLLASASGFTQYAFAFVQQDADEMESRDLAAANALYTRSRRLYLRARDYGLKGLALRHPGFDQELRANPRTAVAAAKRADVPWLYWTAASWGAAISLSKDNPGLVAEQPMVEALMDRALELDETYDYGAIHTFLISYEPARQGIKGDAAERSRKHFERAMALSGGNQAGPLVALAETVSVEKQDRREFEALLNRSLAIDPGVRPEWRLANLVMQRRARWLLSRIDELILETAR